MAGHKISGYISSLWQALFASFTQLFTCIFRFTKNTTTSKEQTSSEKPPIFQSTSPHDPEHSIAPQDGDSPDLELGIPLQDQVMAASKKRGGQKRSGVKANGANPTANHDTSPADQQKDKENIGPGKQPGQTPTFLPVNKNGAFNAPPLTGKQHPRAQPKQIEGQKPNGPKTTGKTRGRSSPTKQLAESKNDAAVSGRATPKVTGPHTPVLTAVVQAESKSEIQKPGSHSQTGTQAYVASTKSTEYAYARPSIAQVNGQVDQMSATVGRLSLDDTPVPQKKELNKDTAAIEAAAVPAVNAVPLLKQPIAPKPLAPLVTPPSQVLPGLIEPTTEEGKIERAYHLNFMREALEMGNLALSTNETPVGCVLVYRGLIIAKGMNATNVTRNGTRHAEFMALSALLSHQPDADVKGDSTLDESSWGDVDPADGHIYPYGQKLHPSPKVNRSIISECVLYVTVEPCVMCASLLRQLGIKRVYFGAVNDKFGGTGGVFRIHVNSKPVPKPESRPYQNGYGPHDIERISRGRANALPREEDDGDGGNVEPGFPAEGGFLRDDAVSLLRRFYVQENGRAPQPRKKEGRAARLYAMEAAANGGSSSELSDAVPQTPVDTEPSSADQEKFPADAMPAKEV